MAESGVKRHQTYKQTTKQNKNQGRRFQIVVHSKQYGVRNVSVTFVIFFSLKPSVNYEKKVLQ